MKRLLVFSFFCSGFFLHAAEPLLLFYSKLGNTTDIIRLLKSDCLNININAHMPKNTKNSLEIGNTALHYLAQHKGNDAILQTIRVLLDVGANPQSINRDGKTPADLATDKSVKRLLAPNSLIK